MADFLTCPLCGFEFERLDTLCAHGCPLGGLCSLIQCPNCEYEFSERPRRASWLKRLLGREDSDLNLPDGFCPANELKGGERGTVLCLGGRSPERDNSLAVFGLVPGAEITLIQQHPSCVVEVGQTQLALDPDIAREIVVERTAEPKGVSAADRT